jgi:hypothetical protein
MHGNLAPDTCPVITAARLGEHTGLSTLNCWKVRALAGQLIEVRRLQPSVAMAGEIAPAPVVGINEDDVGLLGWCINAVKDAQRREQQGDKECEDKFHEVSSMQMDLVKT